MRYNFIGTRSSRVVANVGAAVDANSIDEALEKLNERNFKEFLITNIDYMEDEFGDWNFLETENDNDPEVA